MAERPILFKAHEVRAILDGRKTQTRRIAKLNDNGRVQLRGRQWHPHDDAARLACPYGQPGDRLFPSLPLAGYDERYCVDTMGRVWSRAKGDWRPLKTAVTSRGYHSITPASDGRYTTKLVHRLVCESFYGPAPKDMPQARHIDGDKSNNAPSNLCWGTQEQNWEDRAAHGRGMGEEHHGAKLTAADVENIRVSPLSQRKLAAQFGVSQSTIQQARAGGTWIAGRQPAPVHEPRWACRLVLEITGVRVERLQAISEDDAHAEGVTHSEHGGVTARDGFRSLWESTNDPSAWEKNPWVWVIEFQRVDGTEGRCDG